MFDINDKLDYLLKEYGIYKRDLLRNRLETAIRHIISEYTEKYGRRIIVRGLKYSEKGYPLLKIISEYGDIIAVVDKQPFAEKIQLNETTDISILDLEQAMNLECDVYVINSKFQGKNIYYDVTSSKQNKYVIDLYTEMRIKYGILVTKPYDEYESETDLSHNKIHDAYVLFEKERNEKHLEELLGACLINRDFVTFYEMFDEAQDLIDGNRKLCALKRDIDQLLKEIKGCIADRKENKKQDIIMHWIDQVAYDELVNFPKLSTIIDEGMFFENAYTVTPYTIATEICLFHNDAVHMLSRTNVEDILKKVGMENSQLYREIIGKGYAFIMLGGMAGDWPVPKNEYTELMVASSVYYWNMLNFIINSERPVFGIVGCLAETHEPWMSPKCSVDNPSFEFCGSYSMSENKIKASALYYDNTIDFFTNILGDRTVNIYMSDHGKWEDIDLRRYSDFAMHTFLSITNLGMKGKVSRVFSYEYFPELISHVICCASEERQEHFFGDMELRSSGFKAVINDRVKKTFQNDKDIKEVYSDICSGYIGIKTDFDTYIRLNNGREIYFLNSDEKEINRISDMKYGSRVEKLRRRMEQ